MPARDVVAGGDHPPVGQQHARSSGRRGSRPAPGPRRQVPVGGIPQLDCFCASVGRPADRRCVVADAAADGRPSSRRAAARCCGGRGRCSSSAPACQPAAGLPTRRTSRVGAACRAWSKLWSRELPPRAITRVGPPGPPGIRTAVPQSRRGRYGGVLPRNELRSGELSSQLSSGTGRRAACGRSASRRGAGSSRRSAARRARLALEVTCRTPFRLADGVKTSMSGLKASCMPDLVEPADDGDAAVGNEQLDRVPAPVAHVGLARPGLVRRG